MGRRTYSQRAIGTLDLVKTILNDRDFYVFGSFARRRLDDSVKYGRDSDLDILVGAEDYGPSVEDFKKLKGARLEDSGITTPNEGIFTRHSPVETDLRASKILLPNYTPVHLVELPGVEGIIPWTSQKIETIDGVKYLILPEKREITGLDRKVWEHNFEHYRE